MITLLIVLLIIIAVSYAAIAVGYVIGMLFAITPYIGEWLTESIGLSTAQLPTIFAWLVMIGVNLIFIGNLVVAAGLINADGYRKDKGAK